MLQSILTSRVLGSALVGALVFSGVQTVRLNNAKEVIQSLTDWQGAMVQTIRLASGNSDVATDTAQAQVQSMGQSLTVLHSSLKLSNDAVDRMEQEARKARAEAEREMARRAAAIRTAEQLREQLRERATTPVAPDEVEAEVRRAQDAAYEAGL